MQWSKRHTTKRFNLLEILIATIVLVIMMGFLFQFVNSAQRLWSASNRSVSLFDTAQIVFDMMETDLKNAQVSDEPGREIPFYLKENDENLYLGLMSNYSSTKEPNPETPETLVGTFPVLYVFDNDKHTLSRCAVDMKEINTTNALQWFLFGMDTSENDYFADLYNNFYEANPEIFDIMATGVEKQDIETVPFISGYVNAKPQVLKITLTIYDASAVKILTDAGADSDVVEQKKAETVRTFSKIIFLR